MAERTRITVRVPDELLARLRDEAERRDVSLTQLILESLDEQLPPLQKNPTDDNGQMSFNV